MKITRRSMLTGKVHTMDLNITDEQMEAYQNGTYVQVAFSHLSAPEREFILNGITPEEWTDTFGSDEEEKDEYDNWHSNEEMKHD